MGKGGGGGLQNGKITGPKMFAPPPPPPPPPHSEDGESFRDWSLITGRGGATRPEGGGGAHEVLPLRKGGVGKSFSHVLG